MTRTSKGLKRDNQKETLLLYLYTIVRLFADIWFKSSCISLSDTT